MTIQNDEIQSLVSRRLLTAADAAEAVRMSAVSPGSLADPIGKLPRRQGPNVVRREYPVTFPRPSKPEPGKAPLDRVMVRGRIDMLILGRDNATLLDYKTDNVTAAEAPARAEVYRPQLEAYRDAIQAIAQIKIDQIYLAFLSPQMMYCLP